MVSVANMMHQHRVSFMISKDMLQNRLNSVTNHRDGSGAAAVTTSNGGDNSVQLQAFPESLTQNQQDRRVLAVFACGTSTSGCGRGRSVAYSLWVG